MQFTGELAAILTAVTWAACALLFTEASKRIGSFSMSHYRMTFGLVLLFAAEFFLTGSIIPENVSAKNWVLLGLSGLTGFFLCDALLFQSYVDVSPRIGTLVFNFYPFIGAILAIFLLSETLSFLAWLGMMVTITGVMWVVLEKSAARINTHKAHFARGVALAFGAGIFQAISFVLAKPAMTGEAAVDALGATIIRAIFGGAAYWIVSIIRGRFKEIIKKTGDKRSMAMIGLGAIVGPFLGVWLSMIAIKFASIGIASTLMALMPVAILPMVAIVYKEKISYRAIVGAIVACLGVAILFNT